MMRKIFGGAMAFSMVGAVVLGGVLAWSNSHSFQNTAQVGRVSFNLGTPTHHTDRIGPNDGHWVATDDVTITNDGGNGGFDLKYLEGHVDFLDVTNPAGPASGDQANCPLGSFKGQVLDQTGGSILVAQTGAGSTANQGPAQVQLAVNSTAPDACQSDVVSYRVTISMQTITH